MAYYDFALLMQGYEQKHYKSWEPFRLVAHTEYLGWADPKKSIKSAAKWLPLPTDKAEKEVKRKGLTAKQKQLIKAAEEALKIKDQNG